MASLLFRRSLATRAVTIYRVVLIQRSTRNTSTSAAYGISALSNRHETQHFHRLSRLPLMEHSPTLKLIHTSEVAPGALSAPFSSSSISSLERQEDQLKQDGGSPERANMRSTQGLRDIKNERDLSSVVAEYRMEIQALNKRLDSHTLKLAELQQIVDKRTEHGKSESKLPPGAGPPPSNEEDHGHGWCWSEVVTSALLIIVAFAAVHQMNKSRDDAIYYETLYREQQNARKHSAPGLLKDCEDLEFTNKAQIRVTVERIIDGVPVKNSNANADTEQSDATESEPQLAEPNRSWSSLFWKKW